MSRAHEFSARLAELLRNERLALAEFLLALSEFDRSRSWLELGYTSLFHYLQRELRLTAGPAFYRMTAAHLLQEYPELVQPLRDGRLCLSTVAELSKVLSRENLSTVLPRFFGASKQQAKQLAAELCPQPVPSRTVITPIAAPRPGTSPGSSGDAAPTTTTVRAAVDLLLPVEAEVATQVPARPPDATRAVVEPKTAELSRLHVTVSRRLVEKLAAARDALSHSHPNATDDEIIEAGLELIIQRAAKRRGLVDNPRKNPPPSLGGGVPASIVREVWQRDGGCCTFPLANGEICGSTYQLELDHVRPKALGPLGRPLTAADFQIRCKPHNIVEGRRKLGDAVMDMYTSLGRIPNAPAPG